MALETEEASHRQWRRQQQASDLVARGDEIGVLSSGSEQRADASDAVAATLTTATAGGNGYESQVAVSSLLQQDNSQLRSANASLGAENALLRRQLGHALHYVSLAEAATEAITTRAGVSREDMDAAEETIQRLIVA